mmetsp:Transcript_79411/g.184271  ORF Transcript_79411/g.184271 Transcript_79411/m.184271 type:complete len:278 (+) Transcript_79411:113-946(+)
MEVENVRVEVERTGIAAYLKDALAVLLEVRPADPILFLNAYFRHAAQPDDLASLAWYLIRACPRSRPCFRDNLHSAFSALVAHQTAPASGDDADGRAHETMHGADLILLLRTICRSLPPDVCKSLLGELPLSECKPVSFADFVVAVEACLAAEEALRTTSELFRACDTAGHGSLPRDRLLAEIESQRRQEEQEAPSVAHEQCMPPHERLSTARLDADREASLGLSSFGSFNDLPPSDALRAELLDFEAEDGVTVADLFSAMWRVWLQGEHHAVRPTD